MNAENERREMTRSTGKHDSDANVPGNQQEHGKQRHWGQRAHPSRPTGRQTHVPPRASAHPSSHVKIRPMYPRMPTNGPEPEDVTRVPTQPPATSWKYESPFYEAESSLSALSVAISEFSPLSPRTDPAIGGPDPLSPEIKRSYGAENSPPGRRRAVTDRLPSAHQPALDISEIDTSPPYIAHASQASDTNTAHHDLPLNTLAASDLLVNQAPTMPPETITTGDLPTSSTLIFPSLSEMAPGVSEASGTHPIPEHYIATHEERARREHLEMSLLHPGQSPMSLWDRICWWLLYPRRIEFVLWLSGTVLLVAVTIGLALITTLSMNVQNMKQASLAPTAASIKKVTTHTCSAAASGCLSPTPALAAPSLTLLNESLVAGSPVQIQGQGFTAHGRVNFTYDTHQLCHPDWIEADAHGAFHVTLMAADGTGWEAGAHTITAYDMGSKRDTVVTMAFVVSTPTATATVPTPSSVNTLVPTPTTSTVGASPTVVVPTPVPTPIPPAPTRAKPTPVPTQRPTPPPIKRTTPTPTPTSIDVQPTVLPNPSPSPSSSATGNFGLLLAYNAFPELAVNRNNLRFISNAMWLCCIGLVLALLLLFIAALLRRYHKRDGAP